MRPSTSGSEPGVLNFTSARGALPYGQHQVTASAVDHFVSDQPCKASTTPRCGCGAARENRPARNVCARLLTLISVTGEARVARTPDLGNRYLIHHMSLNTISFDRSRLHWRE